MPYYFWALHLAPTVGKKSIFFLALLKKSWKITHLCSTFLNRLLLSTIPKPTIKFHKEKSDVQNDLVKQD